MGKIKKLSCKRKNLIISSIFSFIVMAPSVAFFSLANTNNRTSQTLENNSLNDSTQTKASSDVVSENIKSFNDYNLLTSSNTIAPVVTSQGSIGTTTDNKSLTLTTFDGILVWNKIFANDSSISSFYKTNYPNQNVSELIVNNYIYLTGIDVIAVLLGTKDNTNQVLFGINMGTGTLYNPVQNNNSTGIVKINDGLKYLYLNSNENIIVTKAGSFTSYTASQYVTMNASIGISAVTMNIQSGISREPKDSLMTIVKGQKNVNFIVFVTNKQDESTVSWKIYMVAVDDFLRPIKNGENNIVTDISDFKNPANLIETTANPKVLDFKNVIMYQPQSFNYNSGSNTFDFFVVLSGENSSVYKWTYNLGTNTLSNQTNYTSTNDTFDFFSFNTKTNRLFISNKKSQNAVAAGYVDLSKSLNNQSFTNLEIDRQNWTESTFVFTKKTKEVAVISSTQLTVPDPYIVLKDNESPIAKYFVNQSEIQNKPLNFKYYKDPIGTYTTSYGSSFKNLASTVDSNNLISSLIFVYQNDNSFKPTIKVIDRVNDDNNGIITFNYQVTYQNWYSTNTNYTFKIATTITGFYAKSSVVFGWITNLTGDKTVDDKWKNILSLKTSKYAYEIKVADIVNNFATLSGKDVNDKELSLKADMVSVSSDTSGYTLKVTINIASGSSNFKFPNNVQTTFTQSYSGFKTISGYDYKVNDTPSTSLANIYPSQLTLPIFLKNFVVLGSKWSTVDSDWDFKLTPDNLKGNATVTLTYKVKNSDIPSNINKTIVNNVTFSGFNSVPKQFKSVLSITDYSGILSPTELWADYKKNPSTSVLFSRLSFPYINNNNFLDITCDNQSSADTDGYLSLKVSIKLNTNTSLYIPNYGQFVYNTDAQNVFKEQNLDTFSIKWNIHKTEQDFNWKDNQGNVVYQNANSILIDLNNVSYDGIDKSMYANEVTNDAIKKLYSQTGYVVNEVKYSNVSQGTLTVVLNLKVQGTQDSSTGTTQTKTILISGFKVPLLSSTSTILFTFLGVIGSLVLLTAIFLFIYLKRRMLNYKSKSVNPKKLKKIKK